MAVGDFYLLYDLQTIQGQDITNVYTFQQVLTYSPVGINHADDLANQFIADWIPIIAALQSEQVNHTLVSCGAVGSFTDFSAVVSDVAGAVSGGCLPSFAAWGFKLQRTTRETRHGSKRLAGVAEAWQQNGVADTPAATAIADVEVLYGEYIEIGGLPSFAPIIMGFSEGSDAPDIANIVKGGLYRGITTQKSRQPGHGS